MNSTDLYNYNAVSIGDGGAYAVDGKLKIGDDPGLGVMPRVEVLGEPLAHFPLTDSFAANVIQAN